MDEFEIMYKDKYDRKTECLRFHGGPLYFDKIDLSKSKGYKDFGPGFYLAESYYHAENRVLGNNMSGFVYVYAVPKTFNVKSKENFKWFYTASIPWLDFILDNRDHKNRNHNYEVVIGPTADANTVVLIEEYKMGAFGNPDTNRAKEALIAKLKTYKYSFQTCLCSYNVVNQIRRIDCISVYWGDIMIDNSGNMITDYQIYKMKKNRVIYLLRFLSDNVTKGDVDKAVSILYSSETFKCLQETETNFWWKSEEELKYLITKELQGDMKAWRTQAFW